MGSADGLRRAGRFASAMKSAFFRSGPSAVQIAITTAMIAADQRQRERRNCCRGSRRSGLDRRVAGRDQIAELIGEAGEQARARAAAKAR